MSSQKKPDNHDELFDFFARKVGEVGLKLSSVINAINTTLQVERRNPDDIDVVITTEAPFVTCGQRPRVGVRFVGMGFDWESGQFRIEPEEKLMCVKHDVPQPVMEWRENYHCPKCEHMLSGKRKNKEIRYCSKCGQAVKWE